MIAVSLLPVDETLPGSFANPVFQQLWSSQSKAASTLDLWGSGPLLWRFEPYADAPDGRRVVQYFDRGRMESTPSQTTGRAIVTQGLLAHELTGGQISLGGDLYESKLPPDLAIDGGDLDDRVPTYAGLAKLVGRREDDRTAGPDQLIIEWVDRNGNTTAGMAPRTVRVGLYEERLGHNLPDVFVALFERQPFGGAGWIDALGYPISEPVWTYYRRNGSVLPSLIQVFERRILVYSPDLPSDQAFMIPSVGRHYYRWRYGSDPPLEQPVPQAGRSDDRITVPAGFRAGVYAQGLGQPVGLAVGPNGSLWLVTQEGTVIRFTSETADGAAQKSEVFAEGLRNPHGIVVAERAVYVSVDDGVVRLSDTDDDRRADQSDYVASSFEPAASSRGAPTIDSKGNVFVAGATLPERTERLVAEVSNGLQPIGVTEILGNPGPVYVAGNQLFTMALNTDGSASLFRFTLTSDQEARDPDQIVHFPRGQTVQALLALDTSLWPQVADGAIFAAISSGDKGSVVRIVPSSVGGSPELVEFFTGFRRPVALAAGLDGALYIADAGTQQIIKIVASERPVTPATLTTAP